MTTSVGSIAYHPRYIGVDLPKVTQYISDPADVSYLAFYNIYNPSSAIIPLPYQVKPNGHVTVTELLKVEYMFPIIVHKLRDDNQYNGAIWIDSFNMYASRSDDYNPTPYITGMYPHTYAKADLIDTCQRQIHGNTTGLDTGSLIRTIVHDLTNDGIGCILPTDTLRIVYQGTSTHPVKGGPTLWVPADNEEVNKDVLLPIPSIRVWFRYRDLTPMQHLMISGKHARKNYEKATDFNPESMTFFSQAP